MERKSLPVKGKHLAGLAPVAALLLLGGASALRGDLLGQPRSTSPESDTAAAPSDTLQETASGATALPITKEVLRDPTKIPPLPPSQIDTETLWLARCIFSETKKPAEQELIAWIIRNRVETGYRGKHTYKTVVLDPYQFSAFNPSSRKQRYYTRLDPFSEVPGWQTALSIAYYVRYAPSELRPFPLHTRHFYSERSLIGQEHPEWSHGLQPITPERHTVNGRRFRFYTGIM